MAQGQTHIDLSGCKTANQQNAVRAWVKHFSMFDSVWFNGVGEYLIAYGQGQHHVLEKDALMQFEPFREHYLYTPDYI